MKKENKGIPTTRIKFEDKDGFFDAYCLLTKANTPVMVLRTKASERWIDVINQEPIDSDKFFESFGRKVQREVMKMFGSWGYGRKR